MNSRNLVLTFLFAVVGIGFLFSASYQLDDINESRKALKLVSNEPLENAPPSLAFATVAMGAFRGLVVDILWVRADMLKEQGQFFDAKQLAEWITILQPRFASVWDFQAWNMAYNISVAMPASQPHERWKWVKNGFELLRDKAIVQNPKSISLYRSLAWIFQHKIGGVTDDVHKYYKLQLAQEMEPLLGSNTNEVFENLVSAPQELSELMKDEQVAAFVTALREADPSFVGDEDLIQNFMVIRFNPDKFTKEAGYVIMDYLGSEALSRFDYFCRAYVLRNIWKLDPAFMVQLNKEYGPVDVDSNQGRLPLNWKHPDAHAIYWAKKGLEIAGGKEEYSPNEVNTDRIVFHSLHSLYRNGKMTIYSTPMTLQDESDVEAEPRTTMVQTLFLRPDQRMFDSVDQAWLKSIEKYSKLEGANLRPLESGHRKMLDNAILLFYMSGQMNKANEIFKRLRELYPMDENAYPIEIFCRKRMQEEFSGLGIRDASEMIFSLLNEAYFRYATYQDNESAGREKMAREIHEQYQREFAEEGADRVNLPEFTRLRYMALMDFLNSPEMPPNLKQSLLNRIKIERPDLYEVLEKERLKMKEEIESKEL